MIGGGAAGLFTALTAGGRGRRVTVIERNHEVGRKIAISGGGRCNFTNLYTSPENFISQNPHFCRSALAGFTPADLLRYIRKHRIEYYEKTKGQLFCRDSSRRIIDMLLSECRDAGVRLITNCRVGSVSKNGTFTVETDRGIFRSDSLVVACGGLSFPKIGATGLGYLIAKQFGHTVTETRPSLVALVSSAGADKGLAGIGLEAEVSCPDAVFHDRILFTHRGLSGPAILQISNYWKPGKALTIDLLPDIGEGELIQRLSVSRKSLLNELASMMPAKLAAAVVGNAASRKFSELGKERIQELTEKIRSWQFHAAVTEGYDRAEVTLGGVSTRELSSQTMASRIVPGLYFVGEVIDVTGWLGGYNFQWAWASGFAAGKAA